MLPAPAFSLSTAATISLYMTTTLSDSVAGASYCYTLDGTTPTVNRQGGCTHGLTTSAITFTPINSTSTTVVQAIASAPGYINSPIAMATYTIDRTAAVFMGSDVVQQAAQTTPAPITTPAPGDSITAGQLIFVYCGAVTGSGAITISSSPANTFTYLSSVSGLMGNATAAYAWASASGQTTFTCSQSGWTYPLMGVLYYYPGSLTALDTQTASDVETASANYTSSAFSTSAKGLIILCATLDGYSTFAAGNIGSGAANLRMAIGWASSGNGVCEDSITTGAQSGITASVSAGEAETWLGIGGAFK